MDTNNDSRSTLQKIEALHAINNEIIKRIQQRNNPDTIITQSNRAKLTVMNGAEPTLKMQRITTVRKGLFDSFIIPFLRACNHSKRE